MISDRLSQLEKNLNAQYKLLAAAEEGINQAQSKVAAAKYEMEIDNDIRPRIQKYEEEYFSLLQQESASVTFVEAEAQAVVDALSQEVVRVQRQPDGYTAEILELLKQIEDKLNEEVTADAKLKGTLSILPPFIGLSYEAQLDTENFCRKYFPTLTRLIKGAKK
jgi:predicted  nucleic acid-binding Zn-ribbon protein